MFAYLIRRLLAVVPVMAVVVTVVFLLIHLIPGDPVSVMLGPDATPTQIDATRRALGLDRRLLANARVDHRRGRVCQVDQIGISRLGRRRRWHRCLRGSGKSAGKGEREKEGGRCFCVNHDCPVVAQAFGGKAP